VIIDRDAGVYPMVGPGLPYDQMITGDFMPTRNKVSEKDIDSSEMF
jgi:acetolactate synthase-1/2/3 large subunit